MRHTVSSLAWPFVLALLTLSACVEPDAATETPAGVSGEAPIHHLATRSEALRPTEQDPYIGIGYNDVMASSFPSPGGKFRVWWVDDGEHMALRGDENGDNVPDFVERVAEVGDGVADYLTTNSWRLALSDETLHRPGLSNGGDGRFDIYLANMMGSDGFMVTNACMNSGEGAVVCSSHFVMENDFYRYSYPSPLYAINVLVPHEYMHAVQNAYNSDMPPWWSEGTATWFEEIFHPEQEDFERLANRYFAEADRTLTSAPNSPGDGFQYSAALFVYYLSNRHDADLIREIFEVQATGLEVMPAMEQVLQARGSSFAEAFREFAIWNIFVGLRSLDVPGRSYPEPRRFTGVTLPASPIDVTKGVNWDVEVRARATRYTRIRRDAPVTLQLRQVDDRPSPGAIQLVDAQQYSTSGEVITLTLGDDPVRVEGAGELIVVAANTTDERAYARLAVRKAPAQAPQPDMGTTEPDMGTTEPDMSTTPSAPAKTEDDGCSTAPAGAPARAPVALFFGFIGLLGAARRLW